MRQFLFILLLPLLWGCQETQPKSSAAAVTENKENSMANEVARLDNTLTAEEKADGWMLLFDGKSTDQWRGYNNTDFPSKGWQVKNGELAVTYSGTEEDGFGGDIITRMAFDNFELTVDFALSDTSNSGIFYLVKEVENTPIWHHAAEYQLLDDETYKVTYEELSDKHLTGANYDMHAQEVNYSKPIGEWNTAKIVKQGNEVEHWLNDSLVVAYTLYGEDWIKRYNASKFSNYPDYARSSTGAIGLQDHGHNCRFKNIKLKKL